MSSDHKYLDIRETIIFPAINKLSIELSTNGISLTVIDDVTILQDEPDQTLGESGGGLRAPRMQSSINVKYSNDVSKQIIFGVIGDNIVLFTELGAINAKNIPINDISEEKVIEFLRIMIG